MMNQVLESIAAFAFPVIMLSSLLARHSVSRAVDTPLYQPTCNL